MGSYESWLSQTFRPENPECTEVIDRKVLTEISGVSQVRPRWPSGFEGKGFVSLYFPVISVLSLAR